MSSVVEISGLRVTFNTAFGPVPAVRGVDIHVDRGETLAIVGESGSGKSTSALGMLGLLPRSATVTADLVRFGDADALDRSGQPTLWKELGRRIGVVFQDPQSSLNPTMRIGAQIGEALTVHRKMKSAEVRKRVLAALDEVAVPNPERCAKAYPHELSGGMRQRVMIAMATIVEPVLLIADEPTTALDVTIQAQIVDLLLELQQAHGTGIVFITHDLSLVSGFADRTMVMYAGEVVEQDNTDRIVGDPRHPYTKALIASVPRFDSLDLEPVPGRPPNPRQLPTGCTFAPRCREVFDRCTMPPPLERFAASDDDGAVRCWHAVADPTMKPDPVADTRLSVTPGAGPAPQQGELDHG